MKLVRSKTVVVAEAGAAVGAEAAEAAAIVEAAVEVMAADATARTIEENGGANESRPFSFLCDCALYVAGGFFYFNWCFLDAPIFVFILDRRSTANSAGHQFRDGKVCFGGE
jgi:hypothetical protein